MIKFRALSMAEMMDDPYLTDEESDEDDEE